jgi:hypothetical protein
VWFCEILWLNQVFVLEPAYSILTVISADGAELIEDGSFGIFGSSAITDSDGLKVVAF